jgi:MFS family permease
MKADLLKEEDVKKKMPVILAIAIFMQMLDSTILNTSLPAIAKDLHESPLNMQNAIVSYVLTLALFMPVSGYLKPATLLFRATN